MDDFKIHILGCGSASPSERHLPACQAIEYRGRVMIIDCGEGAQLSIRRNHLKFTRITDIFISHLHGDHLLGLPGLLSTLALNDVGGKVTVHIFKEGAQLIKHIISLVAHALTYELIFDILDPSGNQTLIDDNALTVTSIRLNHTIPCVGFRFDEKPKLRHINGEMARHFGVPHYMMNSLREGHDYITADGEVIANSRLTTPPTPSYSYAYCSDTVCDPGIVKNIHDVTLLYHEATYDAASAKLAFSRGHSTSVQAARIAAQANVQGLVIGHFSSKYPSTDPLVTEAQTIFPNTIAANEGMTLTLGQQLILQ